VSWYFNDRISRCRHNVSLSVSDLLAYSNTAQYHNNWANMQ